MGRPEFASDIPRETFETVRGMLEAARRKTRPRKHDLYDVFCAVLYFLNSGGAWRSLPPDFPPWRTVHEYYSQWTLNRGAQPSLLEVALQQLGHTAALQRLRELHGPPR
jgi:transposase